MLSLVSLFTDMASEMLYPVMPIFLKSIGFSVLFIGLLEGIAEAIAGLSKGYFGKLSDARGERVPFVRWGYALSAISKPLLAVSVFPLWIFLARTIDRLGKGIRTGARDAMLSAEATTETKARIFGLHRAMDTAGAFVGPSLALLFLYFYPERYQILFLVAFAPGVAAVFLTFLLKEKSQTKIESASVSLFSFVKYWKDSNPSYKKLVSGLLFFALINSSDVFLLLKLKESGLSDVQLIGAYIFYNLVYALIAYPAGALADRWGFKKTLLVGLLLFTLVYGGMSLNESGWWFGFLFLMYGIYSACTESIAKAWITNISRKKETATAVGTYTAFQSICTLIASAGAGLVWFSLGSTFLFFATAILTGLVILYFLITKI
ncbi:MAG TPA: MFS transporter [Cytophagales bacterium]|nr:MFS transporter [Cytophagales bacterium]